MALVEVKVPDIGDFDEVGVIEVLVKVGDTVKVEQSLITVESDKASMEIPSSAAGVVTELKVKLGDKAVTTANRDFAAKLSAWAFKESGVLKVGKVVHYQDDGASKKLNASIPESNPTIYRVKSDVVSISLPYKLDESFELTVPPALPSRNLRVDQRPPRALRPRLGRPSAARI